MERNSNQETQRTFSLSDFSIGKPIAIGAFGKVYLAKLNSPEVVIALKQISKKKLSKSQYYHLIAREIEIQSSFDHPNILKFFDYFTTENSIYLILEYAMHGDLWSFMRTQPKRRLTETQGASCLKQIALAFNHMHKKGFIHRDLKPENIVIDHNFSVKLADFGWAASIHKDRQTYCGTTDYIAPEVANRRKYSKHVDIWGLGVLAFELCSGCAPFSADSDENTKTKIKMVEYNMPGYFSEELKNFISNILVQDVKDRLDIYGILRHPWLKQAKSTIN